MVNTSLLFKGGALEEVKDGLEAPWCPGYVDGSSGFYGTENERTHISTPVQLEVYSRGMRTYIVSRH